MLRESWDSVKQTASALASAWHTIVDFKPKSRIRRSVIVAFEDNNFHNKH